MDIFLALLRGINVGGHHKLPMADLRKILTSLGASKVKTYIQSGNAVFCLPLEKAKKFPQHLTAAIEKEAGFKPHVVMVGHKAFQGILEKNPYAGSFAFNEDDYSKLHVMFLDKTAAPGRLTEIRKGLSDTEQMKPIGRAIYFYAPDGIARSKAVNRLAVVFKDGTARNWRTCQKLAGIADEIA